MRRIFTRGKGRLARRSAHPNLRKKYPDFESAVNSR